MGNFFYLQIVLNEFLEERLELDYQELSRRETSPEAKHQKNKSGNGLKSKNRVPKKMDPDQWERKQANNSVNSGETKPKKRHLLDLNEEMREQILRDAADDTGPKRLKASDDGSGSSGATETKKSSTKREDRSKIELSEEDLYGPFDFKAHRQDKNRGPGRSSQAKERDFVGMREDLKSLLPSTVTSGSGTSSSTSSSVEVVDLAATPPPPPIVDLSNPDEGEKKDLLSQFLAMFPDAPRQYLVEQTEELAGKPAAIERFINELLERNSRPPDYWQPPEKKEHGSVRAEPTAATPTSSVLVQEGHIRPYHNAEMEDYDDKIAAAVAAAATIAEEESEEEKVERKLATVQSLFPDTDPGFLHQKVTEMMHDDNALNMFINEGLEKKGKDFPSRAEYHKRQKEAELQEKYSQELTAKEILDMYDGDPESYFSDLKRKVSDVYKRHASAHLKKVFRNLNAAVINRALTHYNGLYYPAYKKLMEHKGQQGQRKTKRPDHECSAPSEIDINFLRELQFSRIDQDVTAYREQQRRDMENKIQEAREKEELLECVCCCNDECLLEDMLPCKAGHLFCRECVQRASDVAIGEGKTALTCLGQCEEPFELMTLQNALKANVFSKWLRKIQLAEVEQAELEGLERCPFCEFATIMDTTPEENKVLQCQNPDCGKESCRLCREISHIPFRCEEVEKDAEVRKRTYIENKMTEALVRKCWKCTKPFLKTDGCNKMTCSCGAKMCYICRKRVEDYSHFYGQGTNPVPGKCPLWSNNKQLHEQEVAKGAIAAKNEIEEKEPEVQLKHDPTKGVIQYRKGSDDDPNLLLHNPGEEGDLGGIDVFLGRDPIERERIIQEQQQIEAMIRYEKMYLVIFLVPLMSTI